MSNEELKEKGFREYQRTATSWMRPYILGEDLTKISVSSGDDPETDQGFIGVNVKDLSDQWYVSSKYAADNLRKI